MANAKIDVLSPNDTRLIADLYNQVFKPPHEPAFFERRFKGRWNPLMLAASIDERPVGFSIGFELKPDVFFLWFVGVLADLRRQAIGSQLLQATEAWAHQHHYRSIRFECSNRVRPMMHMAIANGYDIIGVRWDGDLGTNLVIFERDMGD